MSLARSIITRWQESVGLNAAIDYSRVFTGRVPSTQLYRFPYCTITLISPSPGVRSDKTMYGFQIVSFEVWVDDKKLTTGEDICESIVDAYANACWKIDDKWKVIDCRCNGPASVIQIDLPTVKAWKLIQLFEMRLERERVDDSNCCEPSEGPSWSGSSSSEWPQVGSLSSSSNSQTGAWPEFGSTD